MCSTNKGELAYIHGRTFPDNVPSVVVDIIVAARHMGNLYLQWEVCPREGALFKRPILPMWIPSVVDCENSEMRLPWDILVNAVKAGLRFVFAIAG